MAKRFGFGQVEPTKLSARATRQIYAQLPAAAGITQLENGQFAYYDQANDEVNFNSTKAGEPMLVFNEVKLYGDARNESYKDFVYKTEDFIDGKIFPRLLKTNIGDSIVTNCFNVAGSFRTEVTGMDDLADGDTLTVNNLGFLKKNLNPSATEMVWVVADAGIGMPDGTYGVKIVRIK